MKKIGICFWIHLCKALNACNRGYFSNEEIRNFALDYKWCFENDDFETIKTVCDELTACGLDYYADVIKSAV